jgi:hypothetical protein
VTVLTGLEASDITIKLFVTKSTSQNDEAFAVKGFHQEAAAITDAKRFERAL